MNKLANPFAPKRALPEKSRQIKAWIRSHHQLDEDVVLSLSELACRDEGCPDIETVIGIMRPGRPIEIIRFHKTIAELTEKDIYASVPS